MEGIRQIHALCAPYTWSPPSISSLYTNIPSLEKPSLAPGSKHPASAPLLLTLGYFSPQTRVTVSFLTCLSPLLACELHRREDLSCPAPPSFPPPAPAAFHAWQVVGAPACQTNSVIYEYRPPGDWISMGSGNFSLLSHSPPCISAVWLH